MLEQKINKDYVQAMKERDAFKISVLSFLRSQLKNVQIDSKAKELSDAEVVAVIKKQIKQRQESIAQFEQGNRQDLASKEKNEMDLLQAYLPPQASPEECASAVRLTIAELKAAGMKDMGRVMQAVCAKLEGRADNKAISDLVKRSLMSL